MTKTIELGSKVLIKPLGLTGEVVGIALFINRMPEIEVEFVNLERKVVSAWYRCANIELAPELKKNGNNVTNLRDSKK